MATISTSPGGSGGSVSAGTRRRAVFQRALRHEVNRLHDPRRILAMTILILVFGTLAAGLVARGEPAGADARAYWAAVRIWLGGGDPYRPTGPFLPYVYAPWMLPAFAPWALLPWDVAWFVWRGGTILALLWSIHWAYKRRPLMTAVAVLILGFPIGANLDTGNINLPLTLLLFGAQFTGPLLAGAIWAMATWMKWVPVVFILVLAPRARLWGLLLLAISVLLSLATLPETIAQFEALVGFGRRPIRLDYLVFLWALVPVLWRKTNPLEWFTLTWWRGRWEALQHERRSWTRRVRGWVGLQHGSPRDRRPSAPTTPPPAAAGPPQTPAAAEAVDPGLSAQS